MQHSYNITLEEYKKNTFQEFLRGDENYFSCIHERVGFTYIEQTYTPTI